MTDLELFLEISWKCVGREEYWTTCKMRSFNKMDTNYQHGLPWVPWKKLNNMMPIKKNQQANLNKNSEITGVSRTRYIYLPKLNVKKLCGSHLRQRTPVHYVNKKTHHKVFSPVLRRGGTVDYSEREKI